MLCDFDCAECAIRHSFIFHFCCLYDCGTYGECENCDLKNINSISTYYKEKREEKNENDL